MEYYKEFFSLEKIEKKFEEYCDKFKIDDLNIVNRFKIIREFQGNPFLESSKNGVINKLRSFIEFYHPIVFRIKDQELECDIIEIRLTDIGWKFHCPDWRTARH